MRKILFLWPLKETQNMPIELGEKYQLNNHSLEKVIPLRVIQNKCSLIPTSPHDTDFFLKLNSTFIGRFLQLSNRNFVYIQPFINV